MSFSYFSLDDTIQTEGKRGGGQQQQQQQPAAIINLRMKDRKGKEKRKKKGNHPNERTAAEFC